MKQLTWKDLYILGIPQDIIDFYADTEPLRITALSNDYENGTTYQITGIHESVVIGKKNLLEELTSLKEAFSE